MTGPARYAVPPRINSSLNKSEQKSRHHSLLSSPRGKESGGSGVQAGSWKGSDLVGLKEKNRSLLRYTLRPWTIFLCHGRGNRCTGPHGS